MKLGQEFHFSEKWDSAVISAGLTNIDFVQDNQAEAELVNYSNSIRLIDSIIQEGSYVVFLSSNAVFDGEKPFYKRDDNRSPRTIYGMLKKRVEDYLLMTHPNRTAILRLTKVISDDPMRYAQWQKDIVNGKIVNMFTNTYISPVKIEEVGSLIGNLVQNKTSGVFQFGGEDEISYYDFAISWAVENYLDVTLIKPVLNHNSIPSKHNSLVRYIP